MKSLGRRIIVYIFFKDSLGDELASSTGESPIAGREGIYIIILGVG
jgi:hypothetical protein